VTKPLGPITEKDFLLSLIDTVLDLVDIEWFMEITDRLKEMGEL